MTERVVTLNKTVTESNEITNLNTVIEFIPNYYYQGMFSIQQTHSQSQNNPQTKKILKNIWRDYEIYSSIINYYRNNIWGPETIFKTVKMVYKPDKSIFDSCQDLLNNYGDTKEYRNILLKKITKLVIIDDDYQNGINKINLLYLNLVLLCFSMDIAGVLEEQEEITQQLLEFLIFCILASINISQIEDLYNYIQKKLYDTLSFGLLFLKDKDEPKYRELMFYIIEPFFEGLNGQGNIKKLFGSKKSLYKNSAIYKVFTKNDADVFERKTTRMDDLPPKKGMSSSLPKKKINFGKADTRTSMKNKPSNKKKNKTLLFIRGNPTQITNNIFVRILNFYKEKKYLFNKNNNILLFYYKD